MRAIAHNIFLAAFMLIMTFHTPAAALDLRPAAEGPSYDETVDFLVNRYHYTSKEIEYSMKIASVNNCNMTVALEGKDASPNFLIDLKKIRSVKCWPGGTSVTYEPISNDINGNKQLSLSTDPDKCEKISKAFDHLRKLCGAKDDPF